MDEIQTLDPGTRIRLIGDMHAAVEDNPRDGAWLLARMLPQPVLPMAESLRIASARSAHGIVSIPDPQRGMLLYVHADDILDRLPPEGHLSR